MSGSNIEADGSIPRLAPKPILMKEYAKLEVPELSVIFDSVLKADRNRKNCIPIKNVNITEPTVITRNNLDPADHRPVQYYRDHASGTPFNDLSSWYQNEPSNCIASRNSYNYVEPTKFPFQEQLDHQHCSCIKDSFTREPYFEKNKLYHTEILQRLKTQENQLQYLLNAVRDSVTETQLVNISKRIDYQLEAFKKLLTTEYSALKETVNSLLLAYDSRVKVLENQMGLFINKYSSDGTGPSHILSGSSNNSDQNECKLNLTPRCMNCSSVKNCCTSEINISSHEKIEQKHMPVKITASNTDRCSCCISDDNISKQAVPASPSQVISRDREYLDSTAEKNKTNHTEYSDIISSSRKHESHRSIADCIIPNGSIPMDQCSNSPALRVEYENMAKEKIILDQTFYHKIVEDVMKMMKNNNLSKPDEECTSKDTNVKSVPDLEQQRTVDLNPDIQNGHVEEIITNCPSKHENWPTNKYIHTKVPNTDVSFHMNALAMKYVSGTDLYMKTQQDSLQMVYPVNGFANSNVSVATLQYLQRHQLMSNIENKQTANGIVNNDNQNAAYYNRSSPNDLHRVIADRLTGSPLTASRVLDVTALRQQPKLL